jgi:hypothetical protein
LGLKNTLRDEDSLCRQEEQPKDTDTRRRQGKRCRLGRELASIALGLKPAAEARILNDWPIFPKRGRERAQDEKVIELQFHPGNFTRKVLLRVQNSDVQTDHPRMPGKSIFCTN